MITNSLIEKVAVAGASGRGDELHRYLGHIIRRGTHLQSYREEFARRFTPEFCNMLYAAAPWLKAEKFGERDPLNERVIKALDEAGREGLARSALRAEVAGTRPCPLFSRTVDELVESRTVLREMVASNGRPTELLRLATHAAGIASGAAANIWHDMVDPAARDAR